MPDLGPQIVELLPKLQRHALALARDPGRADDLVQDKVIAALRSAEQFQPGTSLRAWLFAIQHSQFISTIRREARRPTSPLQDDAGHCLGAFEDAVALRELDHAVGRLPINQRAALLLAVLEDMSYEEISTVAGVPMGTVRSRISRARDRLRRPAGPEPSPICMGLFFRIWRSAPAASRARGPRPGRVLRP